MTVARETEILARPEFGTGEPGPIYVPEYIHATRANGQLQQWLLASASVPYGILPHVRKGGEVYVDGGCRPGKTIKECRKQGGIEAVRELIDCWIPWNEIISQSIVEVDEYGCAIVTDDNFAGIIKGVDVTRIRVCEISGTLFWAGRQDSLCCLSNCADKRRKRQHRASYKARLADEIEAERARSSP